MDNITHSLIGLGVGEAANQLRGQDKRDLRVPLWLASVLANNIPDIDFIYSGITPGRLGYLLHHRGHTHTVPAFFLEAAFILAIFFIWQKKTKQKYSAKDWLWLSAVTLLGPVLHVAMDYTNIYGVHPFWPFDNTWHYGDFLFIVEPLIWIMLAPPLILASKTRTAKLLFSGILALAVGLELFSGYVPWQMALFSSLVAVWMLGLMHKLSAAGRIRAGLAGLAIVLSFFASVSQSIKADLWSRMPELFPQQSIEEIAISPMPSNPFCWTVFTSGHSGDRYLARRAIFSASPTLLPVANCPNLISEETTAALSPVPAPTRPDLIWVGQFEAPTRELHELKRSYCGVGAIAQFTRIPFWKRTERGAIVGDLRFDRSAKNDFPETVFGDGGYGAECPANLPPWEAPRRDIFGTL